MKTAEEMQETIFRFAEKIDRLNREKIAVVKRLQELAEEAHHLWRYDNSVGERPLGRREAYRRAVEIITGQDGEL